MHWLRALAFAVCVYVVCIRSFIVTVQNKKKAAEQLVINNARTKQNNFINAVTVGNVLKYKRKEKKRVFALPYESHYVIMYYYTVSMLIDWNIKCDIYASLCVVKHCAFAVKTGESITVCIALDCIAVLMLVKLLEAPPTISGGAVLPAYIGGWLVGEGHSLLSSP